MAGSPLIRGPKACSKIAHFAQYAFCFIMSCAVFFLREPAFQALVSRGGAQYTYHIIVACIQIEYYFDGNAKLGEQLTVCCRLVNGVTSLDAFSHLNVTRITCQLSHSFLYCHFFFMMSNSLQASPTFLLEVAVLCQNKLKNKTLALSFSFRSLLSLIIVASQEWKYPLTELKRLQQGQ